MAELEQNEWLKIGIVNGWCSPPVCLSHDGYPTTQEEDEELNEGYDPCIHIIRPYSSPEELQAVEQNFSPACWRKGPYEPGN